MKCSRLICRRIWVRLENVKRFIYTVDLNNIRKPIDYALIIQFIGSFCLPCYENVLVYERKRSLVFVTARRGRKYVDNSFYNRLKHRVKSDCC